MKVYKKIGIVVIAVLALLLLFAVWYNYEFSMNEAETMEINAPNLESKILIATQGSEFKDKVTSSLTDYYKEKSVFIKVIDVASLKDVYPESYEAIVVMHTWEYSKPPQAVKNFIERTKEFKEKMVVLSTSGEGSYKIEGIDALTGESILQNAEEFSNKIISKVDAILAMNTKFKTQEK